MRKLIVRAFNISLDLVSSTTLGNGTPSWSTGGIADADGPPHGARRLPNRSHRPGVSAIVPSCSI